MGLYEVTQVKQLFWQGHPSSLRPDPPVAERVNALCDKALRGIPKRAKKAPSLPFSSLHAPGDMGAPRAANRIMISTV